MPIKPPKLLLNLPPADILKWFADKGLKYTWDWHELWQQEHARAFTVAKVLKLDILQTIRDELQRAFETGETLDAFRKRLQPKLKALGWWGRVEAQDVPGWTPETGIEPTTPVQLGSPWRLATIYNANTDTAYGASRWRSQWQARLTHPFLQYLAIMDNRVRDDHAALHEKVFAIDDPFWRYFYPPNDWNCRCRVRSLTAAQVKARGLTVDQTGPHNFGLEEYIGKDGRMEQRAWYSMKNGVKVRTGRGWTSNPAGDWQPDLDAYPSDLRKLFETNGSGAPQSAP
jgi:SPP1 gp7 family putative phage head morphogenesis protein